MVVQGASITGRSLPDAALERPSMGLARLSRAADVLNALLIFTSFFGLLGLGVLLNTAEAVRNLHSSRSEHGTGA